MKRAAALCALVPLAACGGDEPKLSDCPAAQHASGRRPAYLPATVLPAGARTLSAESIGGRSVATIAVPGSIEHAFKTIETRARGAGLDVTGEDYEGSEAEISLRSSRDLLALRFGELGGCDDVTILQATRAPR